MQAASRVARAALPYGQWLVLFVQLGHVGYNLFQLYRNYQAQMEMDARLGRDRTFSETMEYVVKARRKRAPTQDRSITCTDLTNQENQDPSEAAAGTSSDGLATNLACGSQTTHDVRQASSEAILNTSDESDEVKVVYDSRLIESNHENILQNESDERLEIMSTASTSMESTNSNRGIVEDIYRQCFICAQSLEDTTKPVATLPFCMHPFHQQCLDGVLQWHPKCPVCDFHIFSPI